MLLYICKKERDKRKVGNKMFVEVFDYVMEVEEYKAKVAEFEADWKALDEEEREWYDDFEEYVDDRFHAEMYSED